MDNKYMKRFSTSLGIREIKLKITMKYHYRPIRMTTIKKRNELYQVLVGKGVRQVEMSDVAGGNVKRHNHFGKQFGRFLRR